jgi:hypothetical protein
MSRRPFAIFAISAVPLILVAFLPSSAASGTAKKQLSYEVVSLAELLDVPAQEAGFRTQYSEEECIVALTVLKLPNGEKAEARSAYFRTAEEANRYFDWKAKREVGRVTERSDNTSAKGVVVGKRAWVLKKDSGWELMWTDGSTFRTILANTREAVLQLTGENVGDGAGKKAKQRE